MSIGQAKTKPLTNRKPQNQNSNKHALLGGGAYNSMPPITSPQGEGATEAPSMGEGSMLPPTTWGFWPRLPWHYQPQS